MLKRLGGGKVIIVDENPDIVAEKHTFATAFNTIYKDIIDYKRTNTGIGKVIFDSSKNLRAVVTTSGETIPGKVVNVIAPHRAPALLTDPILGLADGSGWVPVDPLTYETTQRAASGIHVIGDSCAAPAQPKSGHMANSQAKVCADAIVRYLSGLNPLKDNDRTLNITTNSACYSPITYSEASWLTANYRYDLTKKQMVLTTLTPGEAPKWDGENFEDMFTWASNLFTDSFT
jgi:NADPH-dependent 2,4-dienoyl-CoA reductase/sulfur reductase-like enzyme